MRKTVTMYYLENKERAEELSSFPILEYFTGGIAPDEDDQDDEIPLYKTKADCEKHARYYDYEYAIIASVLLTVGEYESDNIRKIPGVYTQYYSLPDTYWYKGVIRGGDVVSVEVKRV